MYLDRITLTNTTPCLAESGKTIVTRKPSRPLNEVLPYLAALPNMIGYNPETLTLTFRRPRGFFTLYTRRVSITQVKDVEGGLELLAALTEAINATWENRHELKQVTSRKRPPRPLEVYAILPGTNCRECNERTCMAFAFALLMQKRALKECLPLQDNPAYAERRAALEALL